MRFYQNGMNVRTVTGKPGTIGTVGNNLTIGRDGGGGYRHTGFIDDVRIYNYARTPAQIREDMLGRSQGGLSAGGRSGMMNAARES